MSITGQQNGLLLSQPAYAERLLPSADMLDSKPGRTPLPLCHTSYRECGMVSDKIRKEMTMVPYRSLLGSLIYLSTGTRPDIATAVSLLGKFQCDPTPADWKALAHLLRYLQRIVLFGILIPWNAVNKGLDVYSDAVCARNEFW